MKTRAVREVTKHKGTKFGKDRRRKHHHWRVTIHYGDGEIFARTYIDLDRARNFAERQKKSPMVKKAQIVKVR